MFKENDVVICHQPKSHDEQFDVEPNKPFTVIRADENGIDINDGRCDVGKDLVRYSDRRFTLVHRPEPVSKLSDNSLRKFEEDVKAAYLNESYRQSKFRQLDNNDDMKFDGGKPKAATLYEYFPNALTEIAKVSTFGCDKYERGSFIDVPNGLERYTDAMHRHFLQEAQGIELDDESGLRHAAHAAWGALCRLEFIMRKEND